MASEGESSSSVSKKRRKSEGEPEKKPEIKLSKTSMDLANITRAQALAVLQRLIDGHVPDQTASNFQSTEKSYGPAIRTKSGCLLCQKVPTRTVKVCSSNTGGSAS